MSSATNLSRTTRGYIPVGKREFFALFWSAFQKAISQKNIESAWTKSGIWPWNPDLVLDATKPSSLNNNFESVTLLLKPSTIEIPPDLQWREMRKAVDAANKQSTYGLIERL